MRKNIVYLLIFTFTISIIPHFTFAINNDTINKVNPVNGRKIGYWIITGDMSKQKGYSPEDTVEEGRYINSRKTGKWIKYWPNGAVKSEVLYKHGRTSGAYITYFQNGKIEEKGTVNGGLLSGEYELYWPNGQIRQSKSFNSRGKTEGKVNYYYANGKKEISFATLNGIETGSATWYYENGEKKKEVNFAEGKALSTKEYESRSPVVEYTDPEIEKGPKIKGTFNSAQNQLVNNYGKTYDENKNLLMDGQFKNGYLFNGRFYLYDEYGLLEQIKIFKNGVYVGNGILGKNGIN